MFLWNPQGTCKKGRLKTTWKLTVIHTASWWQRIAEEYDMPQNPLEGDILWSFPGTTDEMMLMATIMF